MAKNRKAELAACYRAMTPGRKGCVRTDEGASATTIETNLAEAIDGDRGGERTGNYPVTAAEIGEMWRAATPKGGPSPDMQRCTEFAVYFSRLMPEHRRQARAWRLPGHALPAPTKASPGERKRLRDAINLLRQAIADREMTLNGDPQATIILGQLKVSLSSAAEVILCGGLSKRGYKKWHPIGYIVAEQARLTWIALGRRATKVSRNGVVAEFTRLVLHRMGFGRVTKSAIADHHAREHARLGLTGNPPGA